MFGKAFGLNKKKKNDNTAQRAPATDASTDPIVNVSRMLNTSGRISLQILQKMAENYKQPEFIRFIRQPVLVGSSIQAGSFSNQGPAGSDEMNKTIVFKLDDEDDEKTASETLKHAIYPLVKSQYGSSSRSTFCVGRVDGNDMIMADLAISKHHAVFNIKDGFYLIRDLGSTNGTTLNGEPVNKKPMKIKNKDIVGFARYEFSFLFPESLYRMIKGS